MMAFIVPGVFVTVMMVALFAVGLIVEGLLALRARWMRRRTPVAPHAEALAFDEKRD